jgi:hypothetical protein
LNALPGIGELLLLNLLGCSTAGGSGTRRWLGFPSRGTTGLGIFIFRLYLPSAGISYQINAVRCSTLFQTEARRAFSTIQVYYSECRQVGAFCTVAGGGTPSSAYNALFLYYAAMNTPHRLSSADAELLRIHHWLILSGGFSLGRRIKSAFGVFETLAYCYFRL